MWTIMFKYAVTKSTQMVSTVHVGTGRSKESFSIRCKWEFNLPVDKWLNQLTLVVIYLYYQAVKITWISNADHHDLSLVCQAHQIVGQQKNWTCIACGEGGGKCTHHTPSLWACNEAVNSLNFLLLSLLSFKLEAVQSYDYLFPTRDIIN